MATEGSSSTKQAWALLAGRFTKGEALRKKAAEEAARREAEKAAAVPPLPDPNEVAVRAWAIRDETTFVALLALTDALIQSHAESRRMAVHSHPRMAFYEGGCASLEALKSKLTKLRTS